MLAGVRVQVRPAGETDEVRATVPVNPFTGATVMVDDPETPTFTVIAVGAAVTEKSVTATLTVAEWDSEPLVPVTVTTKFVAVVEEHDRLEVWLAPRTMLVGVKVQVRPAGATEDVRATVPVNPLIGATVIVEVTAVPAVVVTDVGLAVTEKSTIL